MNYPTCDTAMHTNLTDAMAMIELAQVTLEVAADTGEPLPYDRVATVAKVLGMALDKLAATLDAEAAP